MEGRLDETAREKLAFLSVHDPVTRLPGRALALSCPKLSAEDLALRLRTGRTRVLGRIEHERVLIDLRTVDDAELPALAEAIREALADIGTMSPHGDSA